MLATVREAAAAHARFLDAAARGDDRAFAALHPLLRTTAGKDADGAYAVIRIPAAATTPVPEDGWNIADAEILPVSWISLTREITALAQHDFYRLSIAMLAAIVLLCALAQRSLRMVTLNLLAIVLSAAFFLWLLRLTGTSLSPLSLISLPLLVGTRWAWLPHLQQWDAARAWWHWRRRCFERHLADRLRR